MRLLWLAEALRAAGLTVHEYPGWQSRGSEIWGIDNTNPSYRWPLRGVVCHATAGSRTSTDAGETRTLWVTGSTSAPAPISQLYLSRSGAWTVGASGRCNHVLIGDKGPHRGYGNYQLLGIEAQNDNRGEPWSPAMLDSYQRGVAALARRMAVPASAVVAHWEHQSGKTDPLGINMGAFRTRVAALLGAPGGSTPAPIPAPSTEEDTMLHGQVPPGQTPIVVCTPWNKSSISFGCDFGRAKLRIAEHEVNVGWHLYEVVISSTDNHRHDVGGLGNLRPNIDRRCIMRVPIDANDTMTTPVGYLAWWA